MTPWESTGKQHWGTPCRSTTTVPGPWCLPASVLPSALHEWRQRRPYLEVVYLEMVMVKVRRSGMTLGNFIPYTALPALESNKAEIFLWRRLRTELRHCGLSYRSWYIHTWIITGREDSNGSAKLQLLWSPGLGRAELPSNSFTWSHTQHSVSTPIPRPSADNVPHIHGWGMFTAKTDLVEKPLLLF